MASYTTFPMIEQEYVGEKLRKNVEFTFPETPYKSVSVTPDYSTMKDNVSTNAETKTIVGEDTRTIVTKPHLMDYSQCCGRIDAIYIQENSDILIKHATASAFAENWLVTTALNVYNPTVKNFLTKYYIFLLWVETLKIHHIPLSILQTHIFNLQWNLHHLILRKCLTLPF